MINYYTPPYSGDFFIPFLLQKKQKKERLSGDNRPYEPD